MYDSSYMSVMADTLASGLVAALGALGDGGLQLIQVIQAVAEQGFPEHGFGHGRRVELVGDVPIDSVGLSHELRVEVEAVPLPRPGVLGPAPHGMRLEALGELADAVIGHRSLRVPVP